MASYLPTADSGDTCCDCDRADPCDDCTPSGACCVDGVCSIETETDCTSGGGNYLGDGTTCDAIDCTQGACCSGDGDCSVVAEADCDGAYIGDGTICSPNPCPSGCGSITWCDGTTINFTNYARTSSGTWTHTVGDCSTTTTWSSTKTISYDGECNATCDCSGDMTTEYSCSPDFDCDCTFLDCGTTLYEFMNEVTGGCSFDQGDCVCSVSTPLSSTHDTTCIGLTIVETWEASDATDTWSFTAMTTIS